MAEDPEWIRCQDFWRSENLGALDKGTGQVEQTNRGSPKTAMS